SDSPNGSRRVIAVIKAANRARCATPSIVPARGDSPDRSADQAAARESTGCSEGILRVLSPGLRGSGVTWVLACERDHMSVTRWFYWPPRGAGSWLAA